MLQVAHQRQHVAAEAVRVGGLVPGLVDAAVDGAAEMLEEGAVDAVVDRMIRRNPYGPKRAPS